MLFLDLKTMRWIHVHKKTRKNRTLHLHEKQKNKVPTLATARIDDSSV